jgi:uroporphyrinogen decarboxylase
MSGECVYDELGIPEDYWRYEQDPTWRLELHKAYNDKAEKIVGRRLLSETPHDPTRQYPPVKSLADVFEAKNVWQDWSWWLQESAHDEAELSALLDRVERRLENLRAFLFPDNWDQEKSRLTALGVRTPLYRGQRGPCTVACSIYGPENTLMLCLDNPDLALRWREAIRRAMLGIGAVLDAERGWTPENSKNGDGRGFWFADDNCCLFSPELYEFFGFPILKAMFDRYAPDPANTRFQHSDSAMGHLLPLLGKLDLTGTNFGPTVSVTEIRQHLPRAVIEGQLAPFTFSRNEHERIVLEFLRDFDQAGAARGLKFATAGSINNGSRLTSMRLVMAAIQKYGRYRR